MYDNPLREHPPPTFKGISKQDLMYNRKGRLVLKSRHFAVEAVRDVRQQVDPLCSAVPEGKGYEYAKMVLGIKKDMLVTDSTVKDTLENLAIACAGPHL